jgi:hypothetical protein
VASEKFEQAGTIGKRAGDTVTVKLLERLGR